MDAWLKCFFHLPQMLLTWSIFLAFGLLVSAVAAIRMNQKPTLKEFVAHCMPIDILGDASFHMDLKVYVIGRLLHSITILPSLVVNAYVILLIDAGLGLVTPFRPNASLSLVGIAACSVVMFVVADFAEYLCHYAEHRVPCLWDLHKVHHSASSLNPFTAKRTHPLASILEQLASGILTGIPGGGIVFLFDATPAEAMAFCLIPARVIAIATLGPLKHSHHPISLGCLDRILISPHMHQVHHSKARRHWNKNFGTNLSVFDWIFGTAYKPEARETVVCGLSNATLHSSPDYSTLHGVYVQPAVGAYNKLVRWIGFRDRSVAGLVVAPDQEGLAENGLTG